MSLANAIEAIIEQIQKDIDQELPPVVKNTLIGYARTLRIALKAAESEGLAIDPITNELYQRAVARQGKPKEPLLTAKEDGGGFSTAELVDGADAGDMISIDPNMPVGAKTLQPDGVYVLQADRKLHFAAEETERLKNRGK